MYTGKLMPSAESSPPACIEEGCNVHCSCDATCVILNEIAPNCTKMPFVCTWDHTLNSSHIETICAPRPCVPLPPEEENDDSMPANSTTPPGSEFSMNNNILSHTLETNHIMNRNYEDLHNEELDQPPAPDIVPYIPFPVAQQPPETISTNIEENEENFVIEREVSGDENFPLVSMNENNASGLMTDALHSMQVQLPSLCPDTNSSVENATLEHLVYGGFYDKPPSPPSDGPSAASTSGHYTAEVDQSPESLVEEAKAALLVTGNLLMKKDATVLHHSDSAMLAPANVVEMDTHNYAHLLSAAQRKSQDRSTVSSKVPRRITAEGDHFIIGAVEPTENERIEGLSNTTIGNELPETQEASLAANHIDVHQSPEHTVSDGKIPNIQSVPVIEDLSPPLSISEHLLLANNSIDGQLLDHLGVESQDGPKEHAPLRNSSQTSNAHAEPSSDIDDFSNSTEKQRLTDAPTGASSGSIYNASQEGIISVPNNEKMLEVKMLSEFASPHNGVQSEASPGTTHTVGGAAPQDTWDLVEGGLQVQIEQLVHSPQQTQHRHTHHKQQAQDAIVQAQL